MSLPSISSGAPRSEEAKAPQASWSAAPKSDRPSHKVIHREVLCRPRDDAESHVPSLIVRPSECQKNRGFAQPASVPPVFPGQQHYQLLERVTIDRNRYPEIRHSAHVLDVNRQPERIKAFNRGLNWVQALFKPDAPGYYVSPKPGPIFKKPEHELYSARFADLHFSLASECCSHNEFLEQKLHPWNSEGEIELKLPITAAAREAIIGSRELLKDQEDDYHCLPLSVKLTGIRSTFPISMQMSLRSKLPESSARSMLAKKIQEKKRPPISLPNHSVWSNIAGAASTGEPSYYTVQPCQAAPRNPLGDFLYIAPEITLNHPDFSRFSVVDFHALREELERSRVDAHTYRLEGEDPKNDDFKSTAFWILTSNFPLIEELGIAIEDTLTKNRSYMVPLQIDSRTFMDVPSVAMDEVVGRIEMAFDRDALFMSLGEELTLVLKPEKGLKGWEEYKEIFKKRDKYGWTFFSSLQGALAQFSAILELAFEPYQIGKDPKLLALESSSYLVGGGGPMSQRFQTLAIATSAAAAPSETADALAAAGLGAKPPVDWGARVDRQTALNYAKGGDHRF